jgi:hypothetical protein
MRNETRLINFGTDDIWDPTVGTDDIWDPTLGTDDIWNPTIGTDDIWNPTVGTDDILDPTVRTDVYRLLCAATDSERNLPKFRRKYFHSLQGRIFQAWSNEVSHVPGYTASHSSTSQAQCQPI